MVEEDLKSPDTGKQMSEGGVEGEGRASERRLVYKS